MKKTGRVTIKEIAERTGFSTGAVHCAIYGKKGVSEKTRQKIMEEVERSGFQLNENASLLKRGEQQIMVVLPKIEGENAYYFRNIWQGVREAAALLSNSLFHFRYVEAAGSMRDMGKTLEAVYDAEADRIQGLITVSDNQESSTWTARFARRGIRTIVISSYEENAEDVYSVKVDHVEAGNLAGEFLRYTLVNQSGRVLVLTGDSEIYSNRVYANAFLRYLRENCPGLEPVCVAGFGKDAIDAPVREALTEGGYLGAFICNSRNTAHFCRLLEEIPQERRMVVIGTDIFSELAPYFDSGILTASIYQFNREQGKRAVEVMHSLLVGQELEPHNIEMPIGLGMRYNYRGYIN